MVTVCEDTNLALLAWQVLAKLLEIVLQGTARMLRGLQLAVQPQHAGLLLEELSPLALWQRTTAWCMRQAPWATQTTPHFPSSQEAAAQPYLQLADPLLQCPRAFGDGALLCQGDFKALDDPVCLLDLLLQAQSGLGSAARKQRSGSSVTRSDALQMAPSRALTCPHRGGTGYAHHCICS